MIYPLSGIRKEAGAWDKILKRVITRFPKLTQRQGRELTNQIWGHKLTKASENLLRSRASRGVPEAVDSLKFYESPSFKSTKHHYLPLQNVRNPGHWRNQPNFEGPTMTPQETSTWMSVLKNPPSYYDGPTDAATLRSIRNLQRGYSHHDSLFGKTFLPTVSTKGPGADKLK